MKKGTYNYIVHVSLIRISKRDLDKNIDKIDEMRIFTEKTLKEFAVLHPDALLPLQIWADIVENSQWTCFADVKQTFNSVDGVGNQRYVFNVKGNAYRIVCVIKFTIGFVYIRFVGTHKEYDKIDCTTI